MSKRISALLFAIISFFTGTVVPTTESIIDTVTSAIFGVPYTRDAVEDDFIAEIDDGDISITDDADVGYVNDMIMVFLDKEITFREKCAFVAKSGGFLIGWSSAADLYVLKYAFLRPDKIEEKCAEIMKIQGVVCALPCLAHKYEKDETPNDPFDSNTVWAESIPQGSNWWLEVIGAREAWDYSHYFGEIKVGVIDAGFQVDHPDLEGKITFPSAKYSRINRPSNHGTHVAGIIAATKNNGVGIAGVCPHAKLICVDWQPEASQFWTPDLKIIYGFIDTVKMGAKVVNFSLGSSSAIRSGKTERPSLYNWWDAKLYSLITASLLSDGYDFVVVQSAGNGNIDKHAVDASENGTFCAINNASVTVGTNSNVTKQDIIRRIIIVGAAENNGNGTFSLTSYSNVGSLVTLAAPGNNIFSCYTDSKWSFMSGTSMAAPIVTGVAALVWSINPGFTGEEVKSILTDPDSTGWLAEVRDDYHFSGLNHRSIELVNAKFAVEEAISRISDVGRINISVRNKEGFPLSEYAIVSDNGLEVRHTAVDDGTLNFSTTVGTKKLEVYDAADNLIYVSNDVTVSEGATTDFGEVIL